MIAQRQIQEALMVFKALNSLAPDYLSSMFTEHIESGYAIRNSANKLAVPLPKANYLKKSFSYRDATSLPCDLRRTRSFNRLKQLINRHIN